MGRPKGYDREQVLDKAMELFWRQGFEATSTQELVEHLGINRNSMYSEFGSKKEFYDAVVDHYSRLEMAPNFTPLETATSGLDEIKGVFDHYAEIAKGRNAGLGCLLANMTVEMAPSDPVSLDAAHGFVTRVVAACENALSNAIRDGVVDPETSVREEAQFLTSTWLGMLLLLRSRVPSELLDATATVAKRHLDQLRI